MMLGSGQAFVPRLRRAAPSARAGRLRVGRGEDANEEQWRKTESDIEAVRNAMQTMITKQHDWRRAAMEEVELRYQEEVKQERKHVQDFQVPLLCSPDQD